MNNVKTVNRIKDICKQRKISISDLLSDCGITKSFVYDLEKRNTSPSCDKIYRIADRLDCSVDYLLGRTDNPNPEVDFNKSLIIHLKKYKRSPEELADALDVDLAKVNKWLDFENKIPSEYILPICNFFGIAYFDFSRQDPKTGELLKIEQKPTIENSSNVEVTGIKYNATIQRSELDSQATTKALLKEIEKVLDRLSAREQMKLMTIIYDYEDDCKKNNS